MKQTIATFLMALIILGMASCNNADKKKSPTATQGTEPPVSAKAFTIDPSCVGAANLYFVKAEDAYKMIRLFKNAFHENGRFPNMKKFSDSVWIDAAVINAFSDLMEADNTFDGVRIVPVAYKADSTSIYLVPTTSKVSGHYDSWETKVQNVTVPVEFKNFNAELKTVNPLINDFRTIFRGQKDPNTIEDPIDKPVFPNLSAKVWLSSCVFQLLADTIRKSGGTLDGVRLYFGAYDKIDATHSTFQKHEPQSTVILVPTTPTGSAKGHLSNWNAIKDKLKHFGPPPGGYNHGELCPNSCGSNSNGNP